MIEYVYNLGTCFSHVARKAGERIALQIDSSQAVTYYELELLSNRLAHWLLDQGLKKNDVVCITGSKTATVFGLMLGCLKIGVIYAMLDLQSPTFRLRRMLENCMPAMLLGDSDFLDQHAVTIRDLNISAKSLDDGSVISFIQNLGTNVPSCTPLVTGADPAYIMFTSGSTGFPKAAVITHTNVLNLIRWSNATYNINTDDVFTNVNPLHFDNSVFDFYAALFNGATLVPFSREETIDPLKLVEKVDRMQCTSWFSVPSLLIFLQTMKALDGRRLSSIRRFIFGGEGYPKARLKPFFDAYSSHSEFFNVYGPTECTCICSSYKIREKDFDNLRSLPPLGKIAPNFEYMLLDENNQSVTEGKIGQLCLLGPQVGKGYYNDPERTAQSFMQNPLHYQYYNIIYKTGDLASLNMIDGNLYIHGRQDNQIKHMGYRIELEEIETAICAITGIYEASVVQMSLRGHSHIVAAICGESNLDIQEMPLQLRELLPSYMIPAKYYFVGRLPKNQNGKMDREAVRTLLIEKSENEISI